MRCRSQAKVPVDELSSYEVMRHKTFRTQIHWNFLLDYWAWNLALGQPNHTYTMRNICRYLRHGWKQTKLRKPPGDAFSMPKLPTTRQAAPSCVPKSPSLLVDAPDKCSKPNADFATVRSELEVSVWSAIQVLELSPGCFGPACGRNEEGTLEGKSSHSNG